MIMYLNYFSNRARMIIFFLSLIWVFACTTVPIQDYSSYRDAVNQARTAGEEILIDFAAAKSTYESFSNTDGGKEISSRHNEFNPSKLVAKADVIDDVVVRLKAWETLVQYNTVLEFIIQGKSPNEVEAATMGLLDTLSSFPSNTIKDFATDLNPAISLLSTVISLTQQEYDRRKALDSIIKVGPYISTHFISLLKKDVAIFYNVRMGLNDRAYVQQIARTTILVKRYIELSMTVNKESKVVKLTSAINNTLASIPGKNDGSPALKQIAPLYSGGKISNLEFEQLQDIAQQIDTSAKKLIALDNELEAYQKTVSAYLDMIDHVDVNLRIFVTKAKSNRTAPPDKAALINSVIRLKKAYRVYQDSK